MGAKDAPSPSNMGRCDICGKTIDLEHNDDRLVCTEVPDVDGFTRQTILDSIVRALERAGSVEDVAAADAFKEKMSLESHKSCWKKTCLEVSDIDYDTFEPI